MSLTTSLTRTLPRRSRSPISGSPATATDLLSTAWSILRSPSSMRLAISTSPSRVSSETEPILRRDMGTGAVGRGGAGARLRRPPVLVDPPLFLCLLEGEALGGLIDEIGAPRARAIDDLDAVLA